MTFRTPALEQTPRLQHFVTQLDDLLQRTQDEASILERGKVLLAQLIQTDDWLDDEYAQPNPERYQQYLLYADPNDRFSVVSGNSVGTSSKALLSPEMNSLTVPSSKNT